MAFTIDYSSSGWKPAEKINVTEGGITNMVIYRSYLSDGPYSSVDDSTHIHVSISESSLYYSVDTTSTDSDGNTTTEQVDTILSICQVDYDKQMYKPGVLTIRMTMSGGDEKAYPEMLKKIFLTTECTVDLVANIDDDTHAGGSLKTTDDKSDDDYFAIARFYYLKKAALTFEGNTAIVTLTCYSPDNKLRKDRFCKVYTGQRFANDVFVSAVESLTSKGTKVFSNCKDPDNVKAPSYYVNTQNLCFLSYEKDETVTMGQEEEEEDVSELLQPYLLQYNESTYDFLCRVANRCGEFLYYDNGVLRIGLPEQAMVALALKKNDSNDSTENVTPIPLTPTHTSYPELSLEEDTGIVTELFTENALDSDKATTAATGHNYFNVENSDDEHLYSYQMNKEDDVPSKINALEDEMIILEAFAKFASAQKKDKAIQNTVEAVVKRIIKCYPILGMTTSTLSGMLSDYKKVYNSLSNKDRSTALNDLYNNLCNFFYSEIEELEQQVTSKVIRMDFDNILPQVILGNAISIADNIDTNYIVTGIKGCYTGKGHSHIVSAVPLTKKATRTDSEQKYSSASEYDTLIAVPTYAVPHVLKGKPQKALIRDTTDPLTMGRVRITYPWQEAANVDLTSDTDCAEGYSPWIRMSTPFAGDEANQGGIFMKPALGTHVIVNYFNDNMEDPYVEGSLYYRKNSAPGYKWEYSHKPSAVVRTIQSASGHGITFIDGEKESFLTDHLLPVLSPLKALLPDFPAECNKGGIVLSDQSGIYKISMSAGSRSININSPVGTVKINAFTGITISAPNGDVNIVGKNVNIKAGNNVSIKAGTNISVPGEPGTKTSKLQNAVTTVAGIASGLIVSKAIEAFSIYDSQLDDMLDLAFLRSSWEVIMRPVEGTLSISTSRNITMTAGKGKTTIPAYLLTQKTAGLTSLTGQQLKLATKDSSPVVRLAQMLELVRNTILEYYMRNVKTYQELDSHIGKLYGMLASKNGNNDYREALVMLGKDRVDVRTNETYPAEPNVVEMHDRMLDDSDCIKKKQDIVDSMDNEAPGLKRIRVLGHYPVYRHRANELKNEYNAALYAYRKLFTYSDDNRYTLLDEVNKRLEACADFFEKTVKLNVDDMASNFRVNCIKDLTDSAEMYDTSNKLVGQLRMDTENCHAATIQIFYLIIRQLDDFISFDETLNVIDNDAPYYVPTDWVSFINSIKVKPANANNTSWSSTFSGIGDKLLDKSNVSEVLSLVNWNGCSGVRATSDVTTGGRILVSSNKGQTLMTNEAGTAFEAKANPSDDTIKAVLRNATMSPTDDSPLPDPGILWDPTKLAT